jgi:hypothetical protein
MIGKFGADKKKYGSLGKQHRKNLEGARKDSAF